MKKQIKLLLLLTLVLCLFTGCGFFDKGYDKGVEDLECDEYEEAVTDFQEAIENGNNVADSYLGLGIAQYELGNYDKALEAFLNSFDKGQEEGAVICSFTGNCYLELDKGKEALEYFQKALEDENISEALKQEVSFNIVAAYEKMSDMTTAKKQLTAYLQKYPDDKEAKKEMDFLETQYEK